MILSRKWLSEFTEIEAGDQEFAQVMGRSGFPVKNTRPLDGGDRAVELDIPPHRPDCLSVIGLAREAAAAFHRPCCFHQPVVRGGGDGFLPELLDVDTPAGDLVLRYTARVVRGVKADPSPDWMGERLWAAGVRPVNNIVDIASYVMLEYGQPIELIDCRALEGGPLVIRRAEEGERFTAPDGSVYSLTPDHLVTASQSRILGLAGIVGPGITDDASDVVFAAPCYDGECIRRGAQSLGLRTESSARFSLGLDPMNTLPALDRACELAEQLEAGEVLDGAIDILNYVPQPTLLKLEPEQINALLGRRIPENVMYTTLQKLGFTTTRKRGFIQVPSWRADIRDAAGLAGELARFVTE